ncbi:MAG: ferrochelatase [Alphaproteobacteria bacterium]|nr:ferrochelatase [Alphaproteobacteria bacterium]
MKKIAVILYNLGGPDSKDSIKPFLFNFFMDPNIIGAPAPIRFFLAKYISIKRSRREAGDSYRELGDKSPLLANTNAQKDALEKTLNENANGIEYKVFTCMRYWHPMAPQVVEEVKSWSPDHIVQLPLYPQFSTTTTWSALQSWKSAADKVGLKAPRSTICCYSENEGFLETSAVHIREKIEQAQKDGHTAPRILFSAHGLPEKIVNGGDPYQHQCERTAAKIAEKLSIVISSDSKKSESANTLSQPVDWQICYQSRVGPLKWIGPSIEEALRKAATDNKPVIVYPHAFTQEHVETLVELDVEYAHMAKDLGLPGYYRAKTVGTNPVFINALATLVKTHTEKPVTCAEGGKCICPEKFTRCCMRAASTL